MEKAQQTRQLEIALPEKTYLLHGGFSKEGMLALIQEALKAGQTLGFPLTRLAAHAETVLENWFNVNDWIEYEMRLNDVLPRYDDPAICTDDANLLNGSLALDILRTHPISAIGGVLHENPFYAHPKKFLTQLLGRAGALLKTYRHDLGFSAARLRREAVAGVQLASPAQMRSLSSRNCQAT